MEQHFESLREEVEKQLKRSSNNVSYETKQYANYRLEQLTPQLHRITRENAYQDWLIDGIQMAKEQYQLYIAFRESDVEDKDEFLDEQVYDSLREQPVCSCSGKHAHKCPLKCGALPREVRVADDIDDGIREFKSVHDGRPIVLLDRQQEWGRYVGRAESELRDLIAIVSTDTIPDDADWPPSDDETPALRAD